MTPQAVMPIAIIGMACRLPGAGSVDAFWRLLGGGGDAIGEVPGDRFDIDAVWDPRPGTPGRVASRQGGFLPDIDRFDPGFFGIAPREAARMDPQQRLLLEVAWEALEDGGQVRERLRGSASGVFVGMWTNDFEAPLYEAVRDVDLYVTAGSGRYAASGRLSYVFDLRGPSLTVDTACSSSLVAVHLACEALRSGDCAMALAGASNLIRQPHISIGYSRSTMLAPDGRCKFGDERADGYVRSEGVAMLVLKPLAAALADGDPVHAVIRGSAVNNDGRSSEPLVSPSPRGQEAMLRDAYRQAGVDPREVQYVEAHGTGTRVGDRVELQALGAVLGVERAADRPCLVGSVKTNIGHTEATAGLAGIMKVALAFRHGLIPASLHVQTLNPGVPWPELPLRLVRAPTPWPVGRPYRGRLVLLKASEQPSRVAVDLGWSGYGEDGIEVREVSGCQAAMFEEPSVRVLAHHLRQCLAGAEPGRADSR